MSNFSSRSRKSRVSAEEDSSTPHKETGGLTEDSGDSSISGRALAWANQPMSSVGLGLFRIVFGALMFWEVIFLYRIGFIENFVRLPATLFNYDFLPVGPVGGPVLDLLLAGLLISTILITIGYRVRGALGYFFLVFTYFFLLDKGYYNNHLYLMSLLSLLMIFMNMGSSLALSKRNQHASVPQWQYRLLQFQIVIVYFFGGIAKINPYWIDLHPVQELLTYKVQASGFEFLGEVWLQKLIMVGGLAFDLMIGFLLWCRRTRFVGLLLALGFNAANAWLFDDINIFPFFMIGSLVLFLDQDRLVAWLRHKGLTTTSSRIPMTGRMNRIGLSLIALYALVQLAMPLRHHLRPGYVDWTGEGQRFAWRMKIQTRKIQEMVFAVGDLDEKVIHEFDPRLFLNRSQVQELAQHPRMAVQFAEFIKQHARSEYGVRRSWVRSKILVTFNGSEPTYMFPPSTDLLEGWKRHDSFNEWMNPLPE